MEAKQLLKRMMVCIPSLFLKKITHCNYCFVSFLYLIANPTDPITVWEEFSTQFQKKMWANKLAMRQHLHSFWSERSKNVKALTEIFNKLSMVGDNIGQLIVVTWARVFGPRDEGVHIRQNTSAHVATIIYHFNCEWVNICSNPTVTSFIYRKKLFFQTHNTTLQASV